MFVKCLNGKCQVNRDHEMRYRGTSKSKPVKGQAR